MNVLFFVFPLIDASITYLLREVATSDRKDALTKESSEHIIVIQYKEGYLCSSRWDLPAPHHPSPESLHRAPAVEVLQGVPVAAAAVAEKLLWVDELAWKDMIHLD